MLCFNIKRELVMPSLMFALKPSSQPDYLNIPDWFSEKGNFKEDVLKDLTGMGGGFDPRSAANIVRDAELEETIKKAAKEVIEDQINLGIDVITDGEVERGISFSFALH